jgi:multiple sugar transport system ATP-binding protein
MSGGQRQRIAIGRAIVRKPKVFLFDEPLSNLDAKLRGQMRIELAKLHRKLEATIIYVTHDQVEAMTLADKIVVMNKGEIMQIASPMEVFQNPENKFVAEFIGSPKMNFITGEILRQGDQLMFRQRKFDIDLTGAALKTLSSYKGKEVELGFRSEDVHASPSALIHYFTMNVHVVARELLGNEKLIYADFNGQDIIAKFRSEYKEQLNESVEFFVNTEKIYLFDKVSGDRIY